MSDKIMQILLALIGCGVVGNIIMRLFFRSERQSATAKAQQEENQMWHDRLAELRDANKDLNNTISDLTEARRQDSREITEKTRLIRKLNEELRRELERNVRYEQQLAAKDRFIAWLKLWHCAREDNGRKSGCGRRKPKQKVPIPYDPPTELMPAGEDEPIGESGSDDDAAPCAADEFNNFFLEVNCSNDEDS